MQNGAKDTANASAPSISADFLTGSTEIGLDRIRTRLLDLTNRNKLLNFRHSPASSLRVVDVPVDTVFRQLRDAEKLAAAGELAPYRYTGFWHAMDTLRDKNQLEALWSGGNPPWKKW